MSRVLTGLDSLREGSWKKLKGHRLGLLANQASLDSNLTPAEEVLSQLLPRHLQALFGAQHGRGGEDQDNMVETPDAYHRSLRIPIFSLYSETREPLPHMLDKIDVLIIDLQDVGTRVYTFPSTMLNCLKAAARQGKKVMVLDRPNPLGGALVEGNLLRPELYSFVGPLSLPMRHGLTMGELAKIFNEVLGLRCDLEIIPLKGWQRENLWKDTGLRWAMPSPNMPLPETAQVYPGQVLWEGTNLSEGRGTCRPFEIFGAPYLDTVAVMKALPSRAVAGCHLQKYSFRPTFHKWRENVCQGFLIHVLDPPAYRPYFTSLALLKTIMEVHEKDFAWRKPPYEYEHKKKPIDLIVGDSKIRQGLASGSNLSELEEEWSVDLEAFLKWRVSFLLYP
jgi:uncharacterized protein YbbC (DUF1343 family)